MANWPGRRSLSSFLAYKGMLEPCALPFLHPYEPRTSPSSHTRLRREAGRRAIAGHPALLLVATTSSSPPRIATRAASTRTRHPGASSSSTDRTAPPSSAGIPPPPPRSPSTPPLRQPLWPPRLRGKVRTPLPPLFSCVPSRSTGARTPARSAVRPLRGEPPRSPLPPQGPPA
jgi:hypothetical protein